MDLNVFLLLPFFIEMMFPEQALGRVSLVVTSAIQTLKRMGTWFPFLGFKLWRIRFFVGFATPPEFMVVF